MANKKPETVIFTVISNKKAVNIVCTYKDEKGEEQHNPIKPREIRDNAGNVVGKQPRAYKMEQPGVTLEKVRDAALIKWLEGHPRCKGAPRSGANAFYEKFDPIAKAKLMARSKAAKLEALNRLAEIAKIDAAGEVKVSDKKKFDLIALASAGIKESADDYQKFNAVSAYAEQQPLEFLKLIGGGSKEAEMKLQELIEKGIVTKKSNSYYLGDEKLGAKGLALAIISGHNKSQNAQNIRAAINMKLSKESS